MVTKQLFFYGILLLTTLFTGELQANFSSPDFPGSNNCAGLLKRFANFTEALPPVYGANGDKIGRQLVTFDDQQVVVFVGYPGVPMSVEKLRERLEGKMGEKVIVFNSESSKVGHSGEVNCHGFVFNYHKIPYLPPLPWIETMINAITYFQNTFSVILNKYFLQVSEGRSTEKQFWASWKMIAHEGDVVVFLDHEDKQRHSGILTAPPVKYSTDRYWVLSKYGKHGTFAIPLELMDKIYPTKKIQIWRKKITSKELEWYP